VRIEQPTELAAIMARVIGHREAADESPRAEPDKAHEREPVAGLVLGLIV
jgi:hypothetical protein